MSCFCVALFSPGTDARGPPRFDVATASTPARSAATPRLPARATSQLKSRRGRETLRRGRPRPSVLTRGELDRHQPAQSQSQHRFEGAVANWCRGRVTGGALIKRKTQVRYLPAPRISGCKRRRWRTLARFVSQHRGRYPGGPWLHRNTRQFWADGTDGCPADSYPASGWIVTSSARYL